MAISRLVRKDADQSACGAEACKRVGSGSLIGGLSFCNKGIKQNLIPKNSLALHQPDCLHDEEHLETYMTTSLTPNRSGQPPRTHQSVSEALCARQRALV